MPSSNLTLAPLVLAMAHEVIGDPERTPAPRVLDVGPGVGKYGLLLREYVRRDAAIHAVEGEARYVAEFRWLTGIYDTVICDDVRRWGAEDFAEYDLVLMIDVLEHFDHEDGERLLAVIRCPVIVCTPRYWFENPEADEYPFESHRSLWSREDLAAIRPLDMFDEDTFEHDGGVLARLAALS